LKGANLISVTSKGSFKNTQSFLVKMQKLDIRSILESNAQAGVSALRNATPVDSRLAAESWGYRIEGGNSRWTIYWTNTNVETGFPVAIMLQYGYSTGTGGYVAGRDYINPAIRPIFDKIATDVWKAVTSA
jgi:hypothetical protein